MCKEIYYRKLTHRIMEAGKSQDLQGESASESQWFSSSLRTGRADGVVPVLRLAGSRPRKTQCFGSGLKSGRKNSPLLRGRAALLFYSGH